MIKHRCHYKERKQTYKPESRFSGKAKMNKSEWGGIDRHGKSHG